MSINTSTGEITPSTSTAGLYIVSYTIAASGGCSEVTTTASVTITAAPSAAISYTGSPFCKTLTTGQAVSQTGTTGGTYTSTSGLSINASTGEIIPSTSTVGTYTVSYTMLGLGGCASVTTTTSVTITAPPSASISYASTSFCQTLSISSVIQTGTTGGTYTSTSGLSLDVSTGSITPSTSTAGTYTVSNAAIV
ncbi:MAG: hypothetical protein EBY31_09050 [Flavobacteriia bacterium]|nr:hypothetical protein [Flavobacteriia bacterium]